VKTKEGLIMITKLARIYLYGTKVYYAKHSPYGRKNPWTITTVHMNGTITIQRGNKLERLNIRKVKPFEE
jgi:hypothetical protein